MKRAFVLCFLLLSAGLFAAPLDHFTLSLPAGVTEAGKVMTLNITAYESTDDTVVKADYYGHVTLTAFGNGLTLTAALLYTGLTTTPSNVTSNFNAPNWQR